MRIIGLHTLGHDTGIAVFDDGRLVFALETERVTREKHDHRVDAAIDAYLEQDPRGLERADMFAVSTNIRHRIIEIPEISAIETRIRNYALSVETEGMIRGVKRPTLVIAHEASHAALAAHYAKEVLPSVIFVNEGRGTFSRNAIFRADETQLRLLDHDLLPWYATGFGWSAMGWLFERNISPSMAGTLMALGAFGESKPAIERQFLDPPPDLHYRDREEQARVAEKMARCGYMVDSFEARADTIATLQHLFTSRIADLLEAQVDCDSARSLALAGGCALNIVANTMLRQRIKLPLIIPPAPNDAGQALGAAIYCIQYALGQSVEPFSPYSNGIPQDGKAALKSCRRYGFSTQDFDPEYIAGRLADGAVVALHIGRGEIGPRALGHRSLLAHPGIAGMCKRVSQRIKSREWFRPLAPVMREETFQRIFPGMSGSPHMLFNYDASTIPIPEARHVDGTARIQTLPSGSVPALEDVLGHFEKLTGVPALINTSLNRKGRAIAYLFEDTISDFGTSDVDMFVFETTMAERSR